LVAQLRIRTLQTILRNRCTDPTWRAGTVLDLGGQALAPKGIGDGTSSVGCRLAKLAP